MILIADMFPKLQTKKNLTRYISEMSFSEDRLTGNMVNRPNHCLNLNDSTVTIFSDYFLGKWVGKSLF